MHIVSIDVDLHRVCAWSNQEGPVVVGAKNIYPIAKIIKPDLFLFEIASPVYYGTKIYLKKLAWYIFNAAEAAFFSDTTSIKTLFAPSNIWTNGYNEEARHALAEVHFEEKFNKRDRHDLGECQAMQYFYNERPEQWVSLHTYMEGL